MYPGEYPERVLLIAMYGNSKCKLSNHVNVHVCILKHHACTPYSEMYMQSVHMHIYTSIYIYIWQYIIYSGHMNLYTYTVYTMQMPLVYAHHV